MRYSSLQGLLPVTEEEAIRAGRDRAWHDASTQFVKSAARVLARRSMEKIANEGDVGAILRGAIANKFGTRVALNELAQTENSRREPAVTDPQEDLPQIPSGRSISPSPPAGQLMEANTGIDRMRQVYGLSKQASYSLEELEKLGWNLWTNMLNPIGRDIGRAAGAVGRTASRAAGTVNKGFLQPIGQDVAAAGRRVRGALQRPKPMSPQLATPEQAMAFRPVGTPPPIPAAAQAAQGGAKTAPGHILPPGSAPTAPGGAGSATAPVELSKKTKKLTEIEGVQQGKQKKFKGPGLAGGLMAGGVLTAGAYGLAKGLPAAGQALQNMTAQPMAYGMGYSNLPYGYGQQEYTNF